MSGKTTTLSFRITEDKKRQLSEIADENEISRSDLVYQIISEWIKEVDSYENKI